MSLVMECLEAANIDLSEPLPVMEGGNIDLMVEYMTGECRQAKKNIIKANKLFKKGQYKEAERLYASAKKGFSNVNKRARDIRTTQLGDQGYSTVQIVLSCIPFLSLLVAFGPLISEMRMLGDSASMIDREKLLKENANTVAPLKNFVLSETKACELACDDKIKRCRAGGL